MSTNSYFFNYFFCCFNAIYARTNNSTGITTPFAARINAFYINALPIFAP